MNDAKQIEFSTLARIMVPSGNDAELARQAPTFGEDSSRFRVMDTELFGFEIEEIEAALGRIADDPLVLPWIRDQQAQPADVVYDTGGIGYVREDSASSRDLIRQDRGGHRMLPAPP